MSIIYLPFEFIIPRRPVAIQVKNQKKLQAWKNFVRSEAQKVWKGSSPI